MLFLPEVLDKKLSPCTFRKSVLGESVSEIVDFERYDSFKKHINQTLQKHLPGGIL